ncbi:hypothetical protein J437_LFUL013167 [Ladona fulva]|uniref:CAP-Gly domain-containing protein n=1 Tax=Ladona fulva TaxID=123851 RepID=A0A8K0KEA6_LADFU|nr:hypothetical protein J437_LFUL013167 [Ladona fulva]
MSDPPRWLIGQRVAWLGSGSGLPRTATARWIGRLPGMGAGWTVGIELDEALPLGGVDGKWAGRRLFNCKRSHGLFVPLASIIPESDLRTRVKQGFGSTLHVGRRRRGNCVTVPIRPQGTFPSSRPKPETQLFRLATLPPSVDEPPDRP